MSGSQLPPGVRSNVEAQAPAPHLRADCGFYDLTFMPVTLRLNPVLQFAEGGELLRLVTTFLGAFAGFSAIFDVDAYPTFPLDPRGVIRGTARGETRIDLAQVVARIRAQAVDQHEAESHLSCMLAVAAWEALKPKLKGTKYWHDADVQFLYHVRNASAHGNRWTFEEKQPAKPAAWRHVALDHLARGNANPLQHARCFYGNLRPGDLLLLLMDIDQKLNPGAPAVVLEDGQQVRTGLGSLTPQTTVALKSRT